MKNVWKETIYNNFSNLVMSRKVLLPDSQSVDELEKNTFWDKKKV